MHLKSLQADMEGQQKWLLGFEIVILSAVELLKTK